MSFFLNLSQSVWKHNVSLLELVTVQRETRQFSLARHSSAETKQKNKEKKVSFPSCHSTAGNTMLAFFSLSHM